MVVCLIGGTAIFIINQAAIGDRDVIPRERGFIFVICNIEKIATQRSAAAAKEIKTLIEASVQHVGQGNALVGDAGETMRSVVASVRDAAALMGEITAASREQDQGIAEVNAAMAQLDTITRQNAALVEEAAQASTSVAEEAGRLEQALSVFKLDKGMTDEQTRPYLMQVKDLAEADQ
jgi:aerotaxis receptor